MKIRESGMPQQQYWESLFDIPLILTRFDIGKQTTDVAELGCGYGTFTIPIARIISGIVHTFDIDSEMIARTTKRARLEGLGNVRAVERDVCKDGYDLMEQSVDACLLFNILHAENAMELLKISAEIICTGGELLIIHWRRDIKTPRGPSLAIRPDPDQVRNWAEMTGLLQVNGDLLDLPPWHYGWRFRKTG